MHVATVDNRQYCNIIDFKWVKKKIFINELKSCFLNIKHHILFINELKSFLLKWNEINSIKFVSKHNIKKI